MKYLKNYESSTLEVGWSASKLSKFLDERVDMFVREQNLFRRMEEFLFYNPTLLPKVLEEDNKNYTEYEDAFDVYRVNKDDDNISVYISWDNGEESEKISLNKEQIEYFVEYMNDTDIYKNAKKYNL